NLSTAPCALCGRSAGTRKIHRRTERDLDVIASIVDVVGMPQIDEVADASVAVVHGEKMRSLPYQPGRLLEIDASQLRAPRRSSLPPRDQVQLRIRAE